MMRAIQAVLFDWDETLGRALGDVTPEERFSALYEREMMFFSPKDIGDAIMARDREIKAGSLVGRTDPQCKEEWIQFYQQIAALLGREDVTRETAKRLWELYATLPFVLYDDTMPTLQELTRMKVPIGIITNHSFRIERTIVNLVGGYILKERIIISDIVGAHKPSGKIFKIGADRVGRPAEACMYVGDSLTGDVTPALENGGYAKALWLNRNCRPSPPRLPNRSAEIRSIADVVQELQS
jgi:HAD superfamily hydrolase (TIGR01549 family)